MRLDAAPHRRRCIHNGRYMVKPYEQMLEQCGFALAAGPLRAMFELEGVTDQRLQLELAHDVVERTMCALQTLTRPRNTVH